MPRLLIQENRKLFGIPVRKIPNFGGRVMALEAYATQSPDTVHTDVLSQSRLACYKARDAFYSCLERESNKKPTEIASVGLLYPVECKKNREEYANKCRPTWVKHFDRQYCAKKRVQRLLDDN